MGANNECIPFYEPGERITGSASAAVVGKRMLALSGNIQSGPGLNTGVAGGNLAVATAAAKAWAIGVASHDAAQDKKVTVITGGVVPVTASGSIAAGAAVEVGADGKVRTLTDGVVVGRCLTVAADGEDAMIKLS